MSTPYFGNIAGLGHRLSFAGDESSVPGSRLGIPIPASDPAPAQGQTLAQLLAAYPGSCAVPANLTVVPFPGAPSGVGDAYIKQSVFPGCMANDLPASEAHVLAAIQQPIATIALTQPTGVPAWQTIPSWAVVGTADHAIPLALQLARAATAHAHITEVDAPHLSMISDPGTVTNVILQAVRATS